MSILNLSALTALISPLSIAPMIDWTNTHFRVLMRLIAPNALLYTEMQTTGAIKNNFQRSLFYTPFELPLALQLGGADKDALAQSAKLAEDEGYSEINLNLGCPSDKVQAGRFGACLMSEPDVVANCILAMKNAVSIPVTAKTRIGIDNEDTYLFFKSFAQKLYDAGSDKLIIHARKAWLNGLNPKQNRTIPPLNYDFAYRLKTDLPSLPVVLNGNIESINDINDHMNYVDGVMIGRLACKNPYALAYIHHYFYKQSVIKSRSEIINAYFDYLTQQFNNGVPLSILLKPILNFAYGLPGAKYWKECLIKAQQQKLIAPIKSALLFMKESEKIVTSKDVILSNMKEHRAQSLS